MCPMAQPSSSTLPKTATANDATPAGSTKAQSISFGGMAPHQIARDGTLWKCPHCLDLMPVISGTSSIAWNDEGCYLCASKRLRPTAHGPVEMATSRGPAHGPIPLQSLEPDGPAAWPAPEAPLAQPEARHNAPAAQAVRVELHTTVKPVQQDWLAWWLADERLGLRHTAMAVVMALALMLMCQLQF